MTVPTSLTPAPASPRSDRYDVLLQIGEGGMGLVYRARDKVLGRDVALKTLRTYSPDELYHLKQEFRSLAQLFHPNLVQLYDLVVTDDTCFFTMELIDGVDLLRHVTHRNGSAGASVDYDRLRDAFCQLARGLEALHGYGKVHRDVKPANILVDRDGRVVLLDFGLASAAWPEASLRTRTGEVSGTLAYMAPEQALGARAAPASDWYAAGIVLYQALTGKIPFDGPGLSFVLERTRRIPPPPRSIVPETPPELDAVATALLHPKAAERPSARRILDMLRRTSAVAGPAYDGVVATTVTADAGFVGRARQLAELRAAFDAMCAEGFAAVWVCGESGIGKTTLIERFAADVAHTRNALVLESRCRPQESVPFKGFDGAIDELARFLAREADGGGVGLAAGELSALARIFPVLGRVNATGSAPLDDDAGEPIALRRRAFAALRALVDRVGRTRPLVLWIDDFQWSDLDSVALLRALCAAPSRPPLLLVLSVRTGEQPTPALRAFGGVDAADVLGDAREIHLTPLADDEARQLARDILRGDGAAADENEIAAIACESGGSPFYAAELARLLSSQRAAMPSDDADVQRRIASVVTQRIADLTRCERRVLDVISVAGEPLDQEIVYALGESPDAVTHALTRLRGDHLIRQGVAADRVAVDTYHQRVRETALQLLAPDATRALHGEIASALAVAPFADPQSLVEHYLHAGDLRRAGEQALVSAERAAEVLAFEQAARLYRRALELGAGTSSPWVLHEKLAVALANGGRGGEAARSFGTAAALLAAQNARDPDVSRLKRNAAEQYLRSGFHDDGLRCLREVLAEAGVKYLVNPKRVILSLILNRLRLRVRDAIGRRSSARPPRAADLERLEVCWSAGLGLGVSDQLRAAELQGRHALLAQRVGDPGHQARALSTEALLMVWEGGPRKRARAARLRIDSERLAHRAQNPNIEAYCFVLRAIGTFFERRLREAVAQAGRAESFCRDRCVGATWELANVQVIDISARVMLGDFGDLLPRAEAMIREAFERGDQYYLSMSRLGYSVMAWLAADRAEEAARHAAAALAQPFPPTFTWPIYMGALANAHLDLYRGDPSGGWRRIDQAWTALRAASLTRLQPVRIEVRDLRARCAIAVASRLAPGTAERRRLLRVALREARRLEAERVDWAAPLADAVRAGVATANGDAAGARDSLDRAALGFEHLDMGLHAAAMKMQRAAMTDGAGSRAWVEQETWMRDHGIVNPARMASVFTPAALTL